MLAAIFGRNVSRIWQINECSRIYGAVLNGQLQKTSVQEIQRAGFTKMLHVLPLKTLAFLPTIEIKIKVKVMESRNRPGVAQKVPGGLGSQISTTFGTRRWWGCQPHAPAAFTPRECSWYSFSLGTELTPGPWYGRKEYVTEKSSHTTGNRSRDRPTSSAARNKDTVSPK